MIKKERLEELIEQGATIWHFAENNDNFERTIIREISLKNCKPIIRDFSNAKNVFIGLNYQSPNRGSYAIDENEFEYFFETKEDAEEYAEFGNITRTERLELPSWEDILEDPEKIVWFNSKNDLLCRFNISFENVFLIIDTRIIFNKPLTRENYNEARRLCVKLFKGEEV